jgi:hypothetical protein
MASTSRAFHQISPPRAISPAPGKGDESDKVATAGSGYDAVARPWDGLKARPLQASDSDERLATREWRLATGD